MVIKFNYDKTGDIIAIDSNTGKKVGEIRTMGNDMKELETKKELIEKAKKMMEERKHPR